MRQISRFLPYLAVLAFAGWCLLCVRGDLARLPFPALLRSWGVISLAALLSLLNYALRILRWRTYLARLGHPLARRFAALTYTAGFAYTLSPGKIGEVMRARYYVPVGVPAITVTAAFLSERLLDLMVMAAFAVLLAASLSPYAGALTAAAMIVVAALAAVALMPWSAVTAKIGSLAWIPGAVRRFLAAVTSALVSTRPLLRPGILAWGFAIGLLAWGFEGAGLGMLSSIYPSAQLNLSNAVGIYGTAVLVGGLSFMPGGLGSTEAAMTALLAARGVPLSQALVVTLACRLVTLWFACCLGWVAVAVLSRRRPAGGFSWR